MENYHQEAASQPDDISQFLLCLNGPVPSFHKWNVKENDVCHFQGCSKAGVTSPCFHSLYAGWL